MSFDLQLLLLLAVIIAASKLAGHVSRRFLRQPAVFGEILAGVVFGPSLLNIFGWPVFAGSAGTLQQITQALANIGVLLLMFIAGLETNLRQLRAVGTAAAWTAICGVVLPLGIGALTARLFGLSLSESFFIGAVLSATSVSISAQTLLELGRLASREGITILGAAVIDDVLGIIAFSLVIAFGVSHVSLPGMGHVSLSVTLAQDIAQSLGRPESVGALQILAVIVLMALFFALAVMIGLHGFTAILDWAERLHVSHPLPAAAVLLVFLFAVGADYFGQVAAITGAFLVGVFLARTRHAHAITQSIYPFTYALFVPIFFMSIGLTADLHALAHSNIVFVVAIILVAVLTKVLGCGFGARVSGFSTTESLRVGVGMISRGEVGLIIALAGLRSGVIDQSAYVAMIVMVVASTVITPVLLRLVFPPVAELEENPFEES